MVQECCKPVELKVHTSSSPGHTHSDPITLLAFYHQVSHQRVSSAPTVLVTSVPLLVSYAGRRYPQRSAFLHLQLVPTVRRQTHKLQKLSKLLLRQNTVVVQRLENFFCSLRKIYGSCQNRVNSDGSFRSSFRNTRCSLPVLVHRRRSSPEADSVPALHRTLCSVLIRSPNRDHFSKI